LKNSTKAAASRRPLENENKQTDRQANKQTNKQTNKKQKKTCKLRKGKKERKSTESIEEDRN
jgi:hypothetical protein